MNKKETRLQQDLTQLRTRLLVMAASVGIALDEACAALLSGNLGRAVAVVDGDKEINDMENAIDAKTLSLLARNQPVAQDLRFIVTALRIVIELERIGDEAASIAERVVILQEPLPEPILAAIVPLMEAAKLLYARAVDVFRAGDSEQALEVCRCDDESTQLEVAALHRIMDYFNICLLPGADKSPVSEQHPSRGLAHTGMHGILICRALNRICRRAANIAEYTYFTVEGVNIKHAPVIPRNDGESSPLL